MWFFEGVVVATTMKPQQVLASLAAQTDARPEWDFPAGAPKQDYVRSPAALRVGRLAQAEGIFCFHFEQRVALALPEHWIEPGCERDAAAPGWSNGVLVERKYQSFRHDLMIASFHPGHRGKWTSHELCHALVGFAWRADATPLFHATAARLAELLPVVLYYYFDELRLQRCPDHAFGGGALYRDYCPRCERCAGFRAVAPAEDLSAVQIGLRYLDAEMAAIARSLRQRRPISHRHGSLDLCSDGLAYARAHRRRLNSQAFRRWVALFGAAGMHHTLEAMQARIEQVARAILLGHPLAPLVGHRAWAHQDLAMRLLHIREETSGEAAAALLVMAQKLAQHASIAAVLDDYAALSEAYVLPPREVVAAVGYALPAAGGRSHAQVRQGLLSAVPLCMQLLAAAGVEPVAPFIAAAPLQRAPLAVRFARWLTTSEPGVVAELAHFEAALLTARGDEVAAALGADPGADGAALAAGFVVLCGQHDIVAVAELVGAGCFEAMRRAGRIVLTGHELKADAAPVDALVIGRDAAGKLLLVSVAPAVAAALLRNELGAIPAADLASLRRLGVVVATHWSL